MGAAFDFMCENENLESLLKSRNRKIREQKKLIIELAKGIIQCYEEGVHYPSNESVAFYNKAQSILAKTIKKKK